MFLETTTQGRGPGISWGQTTGELKATLPVLSHLLLTQVLVSGDDAGIVTDSPFASVGGRLTTLSL